MFNPAIGEKIFVNYYDGLADCEDTLELDTIESAEKKLSELYEKQSDPENRFSINFIIKGVRLECDPIKTITKVKLKKKE